MKPEEPEEPEPLFTADDLKRIDEMTKQCVTAFNTVITIPDDSQTVSYLNELIRECYAQYYKASSEAGIPQLYLIDNFPYVYNYYGDTKDEDAAFKTMCGWICAMQLSELYPYKRNKLYRTGYGLGGYTMNSNIYGYDFRSDPNVARVVASAVWAAMRGMKKPDVRTMRQEVGGNTYPDSLATIYDKTSPNKVSSNDFFIDFRKFMNSAPGPYCPSYKDRSGINPTFPDAKTSNNCLQTDMDIHNHIVKTYNLDDQHAVQAIADKDWDNKHMFGDDKTGVHGYSFAAVFGQDTIGMTLPTSGIMADFVSLVKHIGGRARSILQHADASLGHYEYGRLRPGCSWEQEGKKHSDSDDRLNVLTDWYIEDGDGNPTGYYDAKGNWVYPGQVKSPKDYEELQKNTLFANSYPSGHSSGITAAALTLIEICPDKADRILREANGFSVNRTVARYHWNSDTIQGRVIGSAIFPVSHATADWQTQIDKFRAELQ